MSRATGPRVTLSRGLRKDWHPIANLNVALEDNRAGELSAAQRRELRAAVHWHTEGMLGIALRRLHPLARDLKAGYVASVEGAVRKRLGVDLHPLVVAPDSTAPTAFRIWVANRGLGNQEFQTSQDVYDVVPEAGQVRLFYLPRSRWVVNIEPLADSPVDASSDGPQTRTQTETGWRRRWRRVADVRDARRKARVDAAGPGGERPER